MKVGILYPRSAAHPGMMQDFMNGLKILLEQQQLNEGIRLVAESIGYGGNEKEVYEKAEKLLLLEEADLLVAFVDLRVLEILKPLLFASGKLLLVVNPGANYPQNWVPQPNILNLTLHHGFLCWLSGKLAAQFNQHAAVTATSFYDCGYLHTAAMVKGFVAPGGKIMFNYVNNQRYDESFEISALTGYLSDDKDTNTLLCVLDSVPASLFYSRLNTFTNAGNLHLFVSPMMLEQQALEKTGNGFAFTTDGYVPWLPAIKDCGNKEFTDYYSEQKNSTATVFSLLGWETGLILKEIFLNNEGHYTAGEAIAGQLAMVKIKSPRGEMKLDPETNYFITPVYKCSLPQNAPELIFECIGNPEKEWAAFVGQSTEGVSSGWTNTYLCY